MWTPWCARCAASHTACSVQISHTTQHIWAASAAPTTDLQRCCRLTGQQPYRRRNSSQDGASSCLDGTCTDFHGRGRHRAGRTDGGGAAQDAFPSPRSVPGTSNADASAGTQAIDVRFGIIMICSLACGMPRASLPASCYLSRYSICSKKVKNRWGRSGPMFGFLLASRSLPSWSGSYQSQILRHMRSLVRARGKWAVELGP